MIVVTRPHSMVSSTLVELRMNDERQVVMQAVCKLHYLNIVYFVIIKGLRSVFLRAAMQLRWCMKLVDST